MGAVTNDEPLMDGGRKVADRGSLFNEGDRLVVENPEAFRPHDAQAAVEQPVDEQRASNAPVNTAPQADTPAQPHTDPPKDAEPARPAQSRAAKPK